MRNSANPYKIAVAKGYTHRTTEISRYTTANNDIGIAPNAIGKRSNANPYIGVLFGNSGQRRCPIDRILPAALMAAPHAIQNPISALPRRTNIPSGELMNVSNRKEIPLKKESNNGIRNIQDIAIRILIFFVIKFIIVKFPPTLLYFRNWSNKKAP
jgi:hypothetical protein